MDWKALLNAAVPTAVALARPGQSGASFVQGWQGTDQQLWQRRQQEAEAQRRQQTLDAETANRDADNTRQDQLARLNRLSQALSQLNTATTQQAEFATDPTQAENALLQRSHQLERSFELPPSSLAGYVPPMQPIISQRKIRRARAKAAELKGIYGDRLGDVADSLRVGEGEFAGMPVTQLLSLAEMERPPKSQPRPRPEAAPGSFEDYVTRYAQSLGKTVETLSAGDIEAARKRYQQADDRIPGTSGQGGGLSPSMESNVLNRLQTQWTAASKQAVEIDRQLHLMRSGIDAAKRGDMAQGAQMVLVTFQKILDPASVVRESEYMRSAAGLSLMKRIAGAYQQLKQGGAGVPLDELQRFAQLAEDAAKAQTSGYLQSVKQRIGRSADRYKIPQDLIFEDYDFAGPPSGTLEPIRPVPSHQPSGRRGSRFEILDVR